jgi:hypothetical protein
MVQRQFRPIDDGLSFGDSDDAKLLVRTVAIDRQLSAKGRKQGRRWEESGNREEERPEHDSPN